MESFYQAKVSNQKEPKMKTINVSDEVYDRLKDFVVDPFEDTPETIIGRVLEIVAKAKRRWAAENGSEDSAEKSGKSTLMENAPEHNEGESFMVSKPLSEATAL